jgi:hypothetical protein
VNSWERRHLTPSGRALALIYALALVAACGTFVVLAGWTTESTRWTSLRESLPGLGIAAIAGIGAVGCLSMAADRRIPARLLLVGLLPAVGRALWIVVA